MENKKGYRRGEIWRVVLDPSVGIETQKTRPCLILQNDAGNKYSRGTTIVPLLSPRNTNFIVNIQPTKQNGLDKERGLHIHRIRSIDSSRIKNKLGKLEDSYWSDIHQAINIHLGFLD